jgi:predicted phage tail protein
LTSFCLTKNSSNEASDKGVNMEVQKLTDLKAMLVAASNKVSELDAQQAASISALDQLIAEVGAEVPPVSDKIYSQADLDAAVAAAILPLQAEINTLKEQIVALTASTEAAVAAAIAGYKAEIALKYAEMQVAETQAETGFAELLK